MTQQIEFTEDDWSCELNMPARVVNKMSPEEIENVKRLKALIKGECATPEEITKYTRIVMAETW